MNQNDWIEIDLNKALAHQKPNELEFKPKLDFPRFYQVCDSLSPLKMNADEQYYVNFAEVRGGKMIDFVKKGIKTLQNSGQNLSHQFFTGHIGGGKSTELNRLKKELREQEKFHVVYFESDEDLDMQNVEIPDILLAITRQVSENLEKNGIVLSLPYFKQLLEDIGQTLKTAELTVSDIPLGLAKLSAKVRVSPSARNQVRQHLDARTETLIDSINNQILKPAIEQLKGKGKTGLVVIVDNLERISNRKLPNYDCTQQEYLFINQGSILTQLQCHVVYTMPLALLFSRKTGTVINRIGATSILPMITVKQRDGEDCKQGIELLKQMVMARAFPEVSIEKRLDLSLIQQIFQDETILNRLCEISGGHVRTLLNILRRCLLESELPIQSSDLERVIRDYRDAFIVGITIKDWELFQKIDRDKDISKYNDIENYQEWLHQLWVLEYKDDKGKWNGIHPLLKETQQFKFKSSELT